jgi:hypothetical protein
LLFEMARHFGLTVGRSLSDKLAGFQTGGEQPA